MKKEISPNIPLAKQVDDPNTAVQLDFIDKDSGAVKASAGVDVADTFTKRRIGLSKRGSIHKDQGLFFDKIASFWMKDVEFPLDLVFMDKKGCVTEKVEMPMDKEGKILYNAQKTASVHAVELPCGWCERHNIQPGDTVKAERLSNV